MKKRILYLLTLYIVLVAIFALQKPLFMLYNATETFSASDYADVILHGLSLDAATAGYLTALPLLMLFTSVWMEKMPIRRWIRPYFIVIAIIMAIVFVVDTALYTFWGFKLDATVFNYLDSPSEAFASVSAGFILIRILGIAAVAILIYWILIHITPKNLGICRKRITTTLILIVMGGGLFIAIRGGLSESTSNIGQVYYSEHQFLNHSAVNPCFSLLSSMGKNERFEDMFDFFPEEERSAYFRSLYPTPTDTCTTLLLNTQHPNVLLILLEGFGATFVESLGGTSGTSPHIDQLAREGVLFTQCYANSYRTDRGTLCTLSGYPGLPQTSVMKIPAKSRTLPSIASSLLEAGYKTDFLYGGDINFTNMKSYLLSTGYQQVTADTDFTLQQRTTNAWGVNDDITFDYLYNTLANRTDTTHRWFTTFLTLSSHEPFEVPFNRFPDDKIRNSFAYTDNCLGNFVERMKQLPIWKDLLIICLPDHGILYREEGISNHDDPRVYHIPMLWTGGAINGARTIDVLTNQTDLPATLLAQLGLPHTAFTFSRNVLSCNYTYPFTFYTYNNALAFRDSTGLTIYSNEAGRVIKDTPSPSVIRLQRGQAILQTVMDDLGQR